ncbi:ParB/RepB/Spo0J family partition protein [Pseudoalteromonas galatheae]|uniref:ParB/RepB/Spo0J family partition protein n=1 Tax=Pseudoalteromonas galatheae TaxID=579562 RepID=UPI0030CA8CC2
MSNLGLNKAAESIRQLKSRAVTTSVVEIDVDLIDFDENQYRKDKSEYDLEGLAQNIRKTKLINQIKVEPAENGRYLLTDGEMRTRAYLLNKKQFPDEKRWAKIPAIVEEVEVIEGLNKRQTRHIMQLSANMFADPGSLFDIADVLTELGEQLGTDAIKEFLADKGQKNTKVDVSRWRALAKVSSKVRRDIEANEITDKETIAKLAKIEAVDSERYQSIIWGYQEGALKSSLANTVKTAWKEINPKNIKEPELEQHEPELEQREPELEQREPELEQREPELEQREPEPEQREPEPEQREPEPEQREPETEQREPKPEQREDEEFLPAPIVARNVSLKEGLLCLTASNGQEMRFKLPDGVKLELIN